MSGKQQSNQSVNQGCQIFVSSQISDKEHLYFTIIHILNHSKMQNGHINDDFFKKELAEVLQYD